MLTSNQLYDLLNVRCGSEKLLFMYSTEYRKLINMRQQGSAPALSNYFVHSTISTVNRLLYQSSMRYNEWWGLVN